MPFGICDKARKRKENILAVFVLDKRKKPLMPCSEKRASKLLDAGRARIHKLKPFTIRLVDRFQGDCVLQPVELKIDPGSKTTGVALVRLDERVNQETGEVDVTVNVLNLVEIEHRGQLIRDNLYRRHFIRKSRRYHNLRYRQPRFLNRTKPKGWLPPSVQHQVDTTISWVNRFKKLAPVGSISYERVKFDMQKMQDPEISGAEYQRGTLFGYEVWEYLLEKWQHRCAYCDISNVPLEKEHIVPKARGGSDRVSNLTLACRKCNEKKGSRPVEEFLKNDPVRLAHIKRQMKAPLKDAAAMNATRNALHRELENTGLPVKTGTGAMTKMNRKTLNIPKTHALDAACVGRVDAVNGWENKPTLVIKCTGRGRYQRCKTNKYGFPTSHAPRSKNIFGFRTGDVVRVDVPIDARNKNKGLKGIGRVVVQSSGSFDVKSSSFVGTGIRHKYCSLVQKSDGYGYFHRRSTS